MVLFHMHVMFVEGQIKLISAAKGKMEATQTVMDATIMDSPECDRTTVSGEQQQQQQQQFKSLAVTLAFTLRSQQSLLNIFHFFDFYWKKNSKS